MTDKVDIKKEMIKFLKSLCNIAGLANEKKLVLTAAINRLSGNDIIIPETDLKHIREFLQMINQTVNLYPNSQLNMQPRSTSTNNKKQK